MSTVLFGEAFGEGSTTPHRVKLAMGTNSTLTWIMTYDCRFRNRPSLHNISSAFSLSRNTATRTSLLWTDPYGSHSGTPLPSRQWVSLSFTILSIVYGLSMVRGIFPKAEPPLTFFHPSGSCFAIGQWLTNFDFRCNSRTTLLKRVPALPLYKIILLYYYIIRS